MRPAKITCDRVSNLLRTLFRSNSPLILISCNEATICCTVDPSRGDKSRSCASQHKLVNAHRIFESWVVYAFNVLDTFATIICYCNKTCSLALELN